MRNLPLLFAGLLIALNSCTKEPNNDPHDEPEEGQALAEAVIGTNGGSLESEDFLLTVPAGAFNTSITLKLYLDEDDTSLGSNRVTRSFRLEGLDAGWSKPITLKIRHDGTLENESYIAIGYQYFTDEMEDTTLVNELLAASDSSGFLKCTLPVVDAGDLSLKSDPVHAINVYPHPIVLHTYLILRGMSKMATYRSACAEITYDAGYNYDRTRIEQFASDMDEAMILYYVMGLVDTTVFQKHRIKVNILESSASKIIYVEPLFDLDIDIPVNIKHRVRTLLFRMNIPESYYESADSKLLRMAAGKGVLRFETYCFFPKEKNWLHWAFFYWSEVYFNGSLPDSETGTVLKKLFMFPFFGINSIEREDIDYFLYGGYHFREEAHGAGFSPVISFLLENYNDDLVLPGNVYRAMSDTYDPKKPVDAILTSVEEGEDIWWPEFFKAYLEGGYLEISGEAFVNQIKPADVMQFNTESDSVKYLEASYPDLSARLFRIDMSADFMENVLQEGDKLQIKLGPQSLNLNYVKALVYGYKQGQLTFLDEGADITLDHLKSLAESGYQTLIVAVVNSASEYPYKGDLNIGLTASIIQKKIWPWKYVDIDVVVTDAVLRSSAGVDYLWDEFTFEVGDRPVEASEDGARFTGSWLEESSGYKYEGGIDITVDPESYKITSFYAWSNSESISDGKVTLSEKHTLQSKEAVTIPVVYWDNDFLSHQLSGTEVCTALEEWTYHYRSYPGETYELSNTLESYNCGEAAEILIFWSREKLK